MVSPDQLPGGGGAAPLVPSRALNFSINIDGPDVAIENGGEPVLDQEKRPMPFDGVVSKMYVDIPAGVNSRAGFALWDGERGRRQYPFDDETEWAAFNDVQDFWPVTFPMEEGDELRVDYINQDPNTDGHLLKVWLVVVGEEALPYSLDELAQRDGVTL